MDELDAGRRLADRGGDALDAACADVAALDHRDLLAGADLLLQMRASVFTQDIPRGKRVARRIESGMVFINRATWSAPELPFGGIKRSGYGRELGPYGMHEFMNLKTVMHVADAPLGARTEALD